MKLSDQYLKVFEIVARIPKGKVSSYKMISDMVKTVSPRQVGRILHKNPAPDKYPCHRVVRNNGSVTLGYVFGGRDAQVKKLKDEGIVFNRRRIDMNIYRWQGK